MRCFGKCLPFLVFLIVSFAPAPECLWAAGPANPPIPITVSPTVKMKVEPVVRALAKEFARSGAIDNEIVFAMLANYLWRNPDIYGAAFAFVPVLKDGKELKSAPYIYRSGDKLIRKDLNNSFDYTEPGRKWYTVPLKTGKGAWSEPYYDQGGGEAWMTTYSVPVYVGDAERRMIGIVTSDVLIVPSPSASGK